MTRNELNTYLAVILTSLDEAGDDGMPSGHVYAALMGHLGEDAYSKYQTLLAIMLKGKLVDVAPSHLMTITPVGRAIVAKIQAHVGGAK